MKEMLLLVAVVSLYETPLAFSSDPITNIADRFYFAANGGVSSVGDLSFSDDTGSGKLKLDPGLRLDVAGGYQITSWLAAEVETGFVINTAHTTSQDGASENSFIMTQVPIMANVTCHIPVRSRLRPFIGAGAGGVATSLENTSIFSNEQSGHDFTFGYQGFAGVRYQFNPKMDLGLEYKFMGTTEHKFENLGATRTHSLAISFSMRF